MAPRRGALCCALSLTLAVVAGSSYRAEPFPEVKQVSPHAHHTAYAEGTFEDVSSRRSLATKKAGSGYWSTRGSSFVDAAGRVVYFSGVVWAGLETPDMVPHGLWKRSLKSHLDQMKALGFNALRLPFSGAALAPGAKPNAETINLALNPDLKGLGALQLMDKVIAGCAARSMKVILDYHHVEAMDGGGTGLWWDAKHPPQAWVKNWVLLAKRYKGVDTVIMVDLFHEVHDGCPGCPKGAPFWTNNAGPYEKYNFRTWALQAASAIQAVEPRWIISVEGMYKNYWWGGNVTALLGAPIALKVPNKLAYSAHEYGPFMFLHHFFLEKAFPSNLVPIMRANWGTVQETGLAPVWIGHFGSNYRLLNDKKNTIERTKFKALLGYIRKLKTSWTIAFWGPDSKDLGGILTQDWSTPNRRKLGLLAPIMHPNFGPSPGQL